MPQPSAATDDDLDLPRRRSKLGLILGVGLAGGLAAAAWVLVIEPYVAKRRASGDDASPTSAVTSALDDRRRDGAEHGAAAGESDDPRDAARDDAASEGRPDRRRDRRDRQGRLTASKPAAKPAPQQPPRSAPPAAPAKASPPPLAPVKTATSARPAPPPPPPPPAPKPAAVASGSSADAHYDLASDYLKQKKVQLAIDELRKGLGKNPRDAKSYRLLGMAHSLVGAEKSAIEAFERFVQLDPGHKDVPKVKAMIADYHKKHPR